MHIYKLSFYDYESSSDLIFTHTDLFTQEEWRRITNEVIRDAYQEFLKSDAYAHRVKFAMESRERVKAQLLTDGTWKESWEAGMTDPVEISLDDLNNDAIISLIEARGFISVNGREAASILLYADASLNNNQPDADNTTDTAQLIRFLSK